MGGVDDADGVTEPWSRLLLGVASCRCDGMGVVRRCLAEEVCWASRAAVSIQVVKAQSEKKPIHYRFSWQRCDSNQSDYS